MQVGRYHVVGHLASGGMAEVLLAKIYGPSGFEQAVVLKRILPHLASQPIFRGMFINEARLISRVHHPNVVRVRELLEDGDELFLVMEYLEGETAAGLQRRLRAQQRTLPVSLSAFIVAEAAAGLHAAHEATDLQGRASGVVHRDVSPENLFVNYNGQVKMIDFGIAKAMEGVSRASLDGLKGKFSYMSPEQTRGDPVDRRSDVFSLGVVLFELSLGRRLFARANPEKTMVAVQSDPIPAPHTMHPGYPRALEEICSKALARDPEERYQTAAEMRRDLLTCLRDLDVSPAPEEELAALMHDLFPERILEKSEMLRHVREGTERVSVPPADIDLDVDVPTAAEGTARVGGEDARRRGHRFQIAVGIVAAVAVGALAYQYGVARQRPSVEGVREVGLPAPRNAPSSVDVTIDSVPQGAEVRIEGRMLGVTPIELESPPTGDSIEVELRLPGYETKRIQLVPDANTDVEVELVPRPGGA